MIGFQPSWLDIVILVVQAVLVAATVVQIVRHFRARREPEPVDHDQRPATPAG